MAATESVVTGGCFCKKIAYKFEGEPATIVRPRVHFMRRTKC